MNLVFKKYLNRFLYFLFFIAICTAILECCFRYQIIDFYQAELNGLNTQEQLVSNKKNVLIFGDSFSAHPNSYVEQLRSSFPHLNFVNSSIPGTGIKQHELIFKKRIRQFKPKAIIYQFYVGNDFMDIEHPVNYQTNGFIRNLYWQLSEKILFLQYFNFKLAFLNTNNQPIETLQEPAFSIEQYNKRVKTYFNANPALLSNTIMLSTEVDKIYRKWHTKIKQLAELTPSNVPIYLLVLPHNAQVNQHYYNINHLLGAKLEENIQQVHYPLVAKMETDFKEWKILNPLDAFQHLKGNDSLFYQNDPHLTIWGQKELGKIIVQKIKDT